MYATGCPKWSLITSAARLSPGRLPINRAGPCGSSTPASSRAKAVRSGRPDCERGGGYPHGPDRRDGQNKIEGRQHVVISRSVLVTLMVMALEDAPKPSRSK